MRVLLISPLRNIDPPCGDIVHTEALLNYPPQGVVYENYASALARGALVEHANLAALKRAWKSKKNRWLETWSTGLSKNLNMLRRARVLFWEPYRIFSVRPNEFDLVHVHAFDCGFRSIDCPVAAGGDIPARFLYTDARGYSLFRVRCIEFVEKLFARVLGVNLTSYSAPGIRRMIIPSKFYRDWYTSQRIKGRESIDIVPTYLPSVPPTQANITPRRIGFVAKDFDAKGGGVLLDAFRQVRFIVPDAELVIVGSPPRLSEVEQREQGVQWLPLVERAQLLQEIFPSFDVFAYPTQFDGMPLVLLEAMSRGIAIASTSYRAIPEMLGHGKAGLLSPVGNVSGLAANLVHLLDPEVNRKFRAAARQHFENNYSVAAVHHKLLRSYRSVITPLQ